VYTLGYIKSWKRPFIKLTKGQASVLFIQAGITVAGTPTIADAPSPPFGTSPVMPFVIMLRRPRGGTRTESEAGLKIDIDFDSDTQAKTAVMCVQCVSEKTERYLLNMVEFSRIVFGRESPACDAVARDLEHFICEVKIVTFM